MTFAHFSPSDREDEPDDIQCSNCGRTDDHRCDTPDPEDEPTAPTTPYGFAIVCRICEGSGRIHFRSVPSDEWIACPCVPSVPRASARILEAPEEYARRDAFQRSSEYLEARQFPQAWVEPPMSEMLAAAILVWEAP